MAWRKRTWALATAPGHCFPVDGTKDSRGRGQGEIACGPFPVHGPIHAGHNPFRPCDQPEPLAAPLHPQLRSTTPPHSTSANANQRNYLGGGGVGVPREQGFRCVSPPAVYISPRTKTENFRSATRGFRRSDDLWLPVGGEAFGFRCAGVQQRDRRKPKAERGRGQTPNCPAP